MSTTEETRTARALPAWPTLVSGRRRRAIARRPREAVASAALVISVLAGAALVLSAAAGSEFLVPSGAREFPAWLAGPLPDLGTSLGVGVEVALVVVMGIAWGVVLLSRAVLPRGVLASVGVLHVLMVLAPPIFSTDVFGYLAFARLGALHGLDPYASSVDQIPADPIGLYLSDVWPTELRSPYGPLFTLLTYALVPFGIPAGLWALKVIGGAAALSCVALVASCARRLGRDPTTAVVWVGLNPLWLTWVVAGAHNDALMIFFAVAAMYLLFIARDKLSGAVFAAAVAVKPTVALIGAFLLVGARRPGRVLLGGLIAGAGILAACFAAFGADLLNYPDILLKQGTRASSHSVPRDIGQMFGTERPTDATKQVLTLLFAATTVALLVAVRRGLDWITAAGWATIAFLLTTTSLHPWYVAALLPLAALSESRLLRASTVAMTVVLAVVKLV
jgi:alpha-1,6-mannosyltransferase